MWPWPWCDHWPRVTLTFHLEIFKVDHFMPCPCGPLVSTDIKIASATLSVAISSMLCQYGLAITVQKWNRPQGRQVSYTDTAAETSKWPWVVSLVSFVWNWSSSTEALHKGPEKPYYSTKWMCWWHVVQCHVNHLAGTVIKQRNTITMMLQHAEKISKWRK